MVESKLEVTTDQNGNKRYVTEVIADNVQFLVTKASRDKEQLMLAL